MPTSCIAVTGIWAFWLTRWTISIACTLVPALITSSPAAPAPSATSKIARANSAGLRSRGALGILRPDGPVGSAHGACWSPLSPAERGSVPLSLAIERLLPA
jgi:hypothetical protein